MQKLEEHMEHEKEIDQTSADQEAIGADSSEDVQKESLKGGFSKNLMEHRRPLVAGLRYILLIGALLLFTAAGVLFYLGNRVHEVEEKQTLYTYEYKSEVGYGVKLLPNSVFEEEWQPEGNVYPLKLTDIISIRFSSGVKVSNGSKLSGDYTVEAVIRGFQLVEDTKKNIYERRYRLAEGSFSESGEFLLNETVEVKPADFQTVVEQIEEEMGGSTDKDFNIVLNGVVYVEDEQSPQEKTFEQNVELPINSSDVYYRINKPEDVLDFEEITISDFHSEKTDPMYGKIAIPLVVLGVLLFVGVLIFTRNPNQEELRMIHLKKLMKKHEDRIVAVPQLPPYHDLTVLMLSDFEALINHSEDNRELILVLDDGNGLPVDDKFHLYLKDKVFIYTEKFKV